MAVKDALDRTSVVLPSADLRHYWSHPAGDRPIALPAWLEGRAVNEWFQIPNTSMQSAEHTVPNLGAQSGKFNEWCGAALRVSDSRYMMGNGGGHDAYAGNEVMGLTLSHDAPAWTIDRLPSARADVFSAAYYNDLRPGSTHTYNASHHHAGSDTLFILPSPGPGLGFGAAPGGWPYTGSSFVAGYEFATGDWRRPDASNFWDQYTAGGDFTAAMATQDRLTGDMYYSRSQSGVWRFRPTAAQGSQWTQLSNQALNGNYVVCAFDTVRKRWLAVGSFETTRPAQVYRASDGANITASITFTGLGESALPRERYQGMCFDEANDRYLVFNNTGATITVQAVDAATWAVSNVTTTGTAPSQRPNGIHNAAQYVPALRGVVLANSYSGNVYFLRTAA